MTVQLRFDARRARNVLLALVGALCVLDASMLVLRFGFGRDTVFGLVKFLDFGQENNLPSWYSSVQLALAALLLALIAARTGRSAGGRTLAWWILAVGFAYLSLDEMAQLHEYWGLALEGRVDRAGIFFYRWIAFAIPLVLGLLLVFGRFLLSLPPRIRNAMIVAGAIYVGSAVGLEGAQAWLEYTFHMKGALFECVTLLEEGGEMLGIALFIGTLLRVLAGEGSIVREEPVRRAEAA